MKPAETLALFDEYLAARGFSFDAVLIGGAALGVLGVVSRETRDCDVLVPEIPEHILRAAEAFAAERTAAGVVLDAHWLNNGPASLTRDLPRGWEQRLQPLFSGRALDFRTLGRVDLLRSKLFALCDRGLDRRDCLAMRPTQRELEVIEPWLVDRDANPHWPQHVRDTLDELAERLGFTLEQGRGAHGL